MNDDGKRKTIKDLYIAIKHTNNPVTKSSYKQAIYNRLERIEKFIEQGKLNAPST